MARRSKNADQPSVEGDEKKLLAKKDWRILCGSYNEALQSHEHDFRINAGDDVSNLPDWVLKTLKTEHVI